MAAPRQKCIFITGAGSGIGRATAQLFAERGWFVGLFDVNQAGLDETSAMLPEGQRISMAFDVRDRAGWARAVDSFGQATGRRMDVLFNNAGLARGGWFEDVTPDDTDLVIDVNLKGVINGVYAALPLLRETPGARIINTASVAGLVGLPRAAAYTATKFAVRGLTEALDIEFSRYGIRVASLMPWFIETPLLDGVPAESNQAMRQSLQTNKVPIYPVRDVAERAWAAAHGDKLFYMVGKAAERARFFERFMPDAMRNQMRRSIKDD
ncbi:MAG: SDR family oxidoreductase [Hyphomonadaceae bacterium]|nr:SDR family oxidoreductase [Hyphomonadaceae bacterium]